MRYLNLQNTVLVSLLVAGVAVSAGCSSGTDAPNTTGGASGSSSGTAGSPGTGGQSSGASGSPVTGSGGSGMAGTDNPGTGGSGGGVYPAQTGVCAGAGTRKVALGDTKIDDFEGAMISPGWSSFNDVAPAMPANSFKIAQEAGGAVATAHSGHYMGTGAKTTAKGGYGVGTVFNVSIDTTAKIFCIDITAFDGVTFWAKGSAATTKVNLNFVLPETNEQNAVTGGGDCVKDSGCFNHPFKTVPITTSWAQYSVKFSEAAGGKYPSGGANAGGSATVMNVIQELVWITLDPDWDFSLDEIQFYKGTPPTGPAGGADAGQ